ncbi:hypothetical protein U1Q18_029404 [Sarracenia purpurea var. burkii]
MVATLLNLMDGICRFDGLLVIAATNRPDSIEPALIHPGRIDREIEIGDRKCFYPGSFKSCVSSPKQHYNILLAHLSKMEHSISEMQVQHLATATHGFVDSNGVSIARYVCSNAKEGSSCSSALLVKARANAPSIIFFDEIDGLAVIPGKESDGVSVADRIMSLEQRSNVTHIAATNRPDKIGSTLLRPADREDVFHIHLRRISCSPDVCIKELALLTEGCTGADISLICREAALAAIEECRVSM